MRLYQYVYQYVQPQPMRHKVLYIFKGSFRHANKLNATQLTTEQNIMSGIDGCNISLRKQPRHGIFKRPLKIIYPYGVDLAAQTPSYN